MVLWLYKLGSHVRSISPDFWHGCIFHFESKLYKTGTFRVVRKTHIFLFVIMSHFSVHDDAFHEFPGTMKNKWVTFKWRKTMIDVSITSMDYYKMVYWPSYIHLRCLLWMPQLGIKPASDEVIWRVTTRILGILPPTGSRSFQTGPVTSLWTALPGNLGACYEIIYQQG